MTRVPSEVRQTSWTSRSCAAKKRRAPYAAMSDCWLKVVPFGISTPVRFGVEFP